MIKKGGLVVREIDVGWDPISSVPVHAEIVPIHKNHVDVGSVPIPESHVDAGTVPILKSRVDTGTIHVHPSMPTEVRIPRWSDGPTTLPWML